MRERREKKDKNSKISRDRDKGGEREIQTDGLRNREQKIEME